MDFGKIKFSASRDGVETTIEMGGDATLNEVIQQFEYFLLTQGYTLPPHAHIGYEYEEDTVTISVTDSDFDGDYINNITRRDEE